MQKLFGDVWGCGRNCTSERADLQTLNLLPAWRSLSEMVSVDASLPPVSNQTGQIGQSDAAAQSNPGLSSLYILIFCAGTMKNNKANTGKLLQVFYIRKPEWTEDD